MVMPCTRHYCTVIVVSFKLETKPKTSLLSLYQFLTHFSLVVVVIHFYFTILLTGADENSQPASSLERAAGRKV
jgi:hypothetical protein